MQGTINSPGANSLGVHDRNGDDDEPMSRKTCQNRPGELRSGQRDKQPGITASGDRQAMNAPAAVLREVAQSRYESARQVRVHDAQFVSPGKSKPGNASCRAIKSSSSAQASSVVSSKSTALKSAKKTRERAKCIRVETVELGNAKWRGEDMPRRLRNKSVRNVGISLRRSLYGIKHAVRKDRTRRAR